MTMSEIDSPDRVGDIPIRSEEIGFTPDSMVDCQKCRRSNAPNRAACMYCGAELEGSTAEAKPELRELESWENGFNVVIASTGKHVEIDSLAPSLSSVLSTDIETARSILTCPGPIPVVRLEHEGDATRVAERLREGGFDTKVVSDESLLPGTLPVRLRSIEFGEGEMILELFGKDERRKIVADDLALIVLGILVQGRTESIEKRKRRVTQTVSETQTTSDEPLIDIYTQADSTGWRIPVAGFDFSCLGNDKSLLAGENIERLAKKLAAYAPGARVVREYSTVRPQLEMVWQSESRKDSLGPQRSGFAGTSSAMVYSTNNLLQLTKFSRLQWHML
jgi:hypothetical protein